MTTNIGRSLVRWMHIVTASAIVTYVYSPEMRAIHMYELLVKAIITPAAIVFGLWLWKGHFIKIILFGQNRNLSIVSLFTLSLLLPGFQSNDNARLRLEITGVESAGTIYVTFCKNASEWTDNGSFNFELNKPVKGANMLDVSIPKGTYAIALFQDLNGNTKLDTNLFGIPKEPYAFSNNIRPKFSEPAFDDCKFNFATPDQTISIKLIK